jgi:hypothetical protein
MSIPIWFAALNKRYPQCGLNADWAVHAWYCGDNEPNTVSGEIYIVEDEDIGADEAKRFYVVKRSYADDMLSETDGVQDIAGPLTAQDAIEEVTA